MKIVLIKVPSFYNKVDSFKAKIKVSTDHIYGKVPSFYNKVDSFKVKIKVSTDYIYGKSTKFLQ